MSANSKSIKFPDKHYVGFQARPSVDDVPLGFMTPDGTDQAAAKRKATVDSWARGGGYYAQNEAKNKLPAQTFDNKPLVGFKLGRNVRHGYGWGQGNVKWRIEDPRGFELEISSPNLAQILGFCTIENGEILEQCIWARLGNENVLVPVNSDVYESAIKNTERMSKSASLKDLKIGDSVVMHNGEQGIYYGAYFVTARKHEYSGPIVGHSLSCGTKKKHVFLMIGADGLVSTKYFRAIGSPKLSQVFEATPMTHLQAEQDMAKKVKEEGYFLQENSYSSGSPIAFTIEKMVPENFVVERLEATIDDVVAHLATKKNGSNYYASEYIKGSEALFEINGKLLNISLPEILEKREYLPNGSKHHIVVQHQANIAANPKWYGNNNSHSYTMCHTRPVINDPSVEGKIKVTQPTRSYYNSRNPTDVEVADIPNEFHYYRLVSKTSSGIEVTCYI